MRSPGLFDTEHEQFRESVRRFLETEAVPHREAWDAAGRIDRDLWRSAGALGMLGSAIPDQYGGAGADRLYPFIAAEELGRSGFAFAGWTVQDICCQYILKYGTEDQKQAWLPGLCAGDIIASVAMTEPGAGTDLKAIRTTARRDGDDYVLSGQKTFITNGPSCDVAIVVAKTDPAAGAKGVSLFLVEANRPGFDKGRNLQKLGQKLQDTGELFFNEVRVPASSLLGTEGQGFFHLMSDLPFERLLISVNAVAAARSAFEMTVEYARARPLFGATLLDQQNSRFRLAELKTEIAVGQAFVDQLLAGYLAGTTNGDDAAMAKYWTTELQCRVADACVQLHGGNGYMLDYPITRAYADARAQRIYGGSNETMRDLIGRTL
ncbi:MAG: acyl-CoA dehydrogenase protein [Caulobacter sp.]|nr:acyl-CoA dehydrogenase protein [Caulobacter sp.]